MRKFMTWLYVASLILFFIDWGIVGVKIFNGNYDIEAFVYVGGVLIVVMIVCYLYRLFSNKCPHCGKLRLSNGDYCSYCGKKID
ncbi:MAG: hypothetical protein E7481_04085 [Ruminococcaceae bacterium]|nr:hypothetical protein [Oscillospiraceae bacterium]